MRVLFCATTFPGARSRLEKLLPAAGHEFIVCEEREIERYAGEVDVLVPAISRIDAGIMERGSFGLVQQYGVGLDAVDIGAATRCGVYVARVPGSKSGNAASVAEMAIYLMLGLSRKQAELARSVKTRLVGEPLGIALLGKTACIVGMGNIGTAIAQRLQGWGMRLTAVVDKPSREIPAESLVERVYPMEGVKEAVADADYILLCVNYHAALRHLVDRGFLAAAKRGAFLVNVARGGLVETDALTEALKTGRIGGAGIDVFWEEPVDPDHPLFAENVIATPHVAGVTDASYDGTAAICVQNIERYARGDEPLYAANRPAAPRRRAGQPGRGRR